MSVTLRDFRPINIWEIDHDGAKYHDGSPEHVVDLTTGRRYWNESKGTIRFKCFLLTLGVPLIHPITAAVNVAYRVVKLVSFYHFWGIKDAQGRFNLKESLSKAGKDALRIIATPLSIVGLELAAIYGLFRPYDGRKLFASIERATYGSFILAPCFQPDPTSHALGGDPKQKDAL
jgi:hypothetical protein